MMESAGETLARSNEMPDDDPQPLPPLGEFRPTRDDDSAPESGTAPPLQRLDIDPEGLQQHAPRTFMRDAASTIAACTGHVLLAMALLARPPTDYGGGGASLDAISVSIVSGNALEAQAPSSEAAAAAAPAQIAPTAGDDSADSTAAPDTSATPKAQPDPPPTVTATPSDVVAAPNEPALETVPDEATIVTAPPAPPEPTPTVQPETKVAVTGPPPTPDPPEEQAKPTDAPTTAPAPEASPAGGEPSRGSAIEQPPQVASAAASPGAVHAYGLAIQEALLAVDLREAQARLSASQARGTVVVRITLRADGSLERAEVAASSGRPQLDEAALRLIRQTTFPPPPPGFTSAERTYLAPIRFK